ncbi:hypothetical protein EV361DRAFT_941222 [Lentinula raphanica]|uniref:Uncharacterized protein n=1 Tax=Lentinula raphanica TaxID=153919 RepID=A0AA38U3N5_9AGAR|nr:hypothetical protein F5878DRAFT_52821 [Lentinula raphanica]KAJ3964795.1 hypothetical protein EV361DRAFT_941222 [Lentinula raphanica]
MIKAGMERPGWDLTTRIGMDWATNLTGGRRRSAGTLQRSIECTRVLAGGILKHVTGITTFYQESDSYFSKSATRHHILGHVRQDTDYATINSPLAFLLSLSPTAPLQAKVVGVRLSKSLLSFALPSSSSYNSPHSVLVEPLFDPLIVTKPTVPSIPATPNSNVFTRSSNTSLARSTALAMNSSPLLLIIASFLSYLTFTSEKDRDQRVVHTYTRQESVPPI